MGAMNRLKPYFSMLWKAIPRKWRWYLLWLFSDHFVVGVTGAVLNAHDQVLLARHVYRSHIEWGLPGGGVQHGERLEDAICREILEETGIPAEVNELVHVYLDTRRPQLNLTFYCSVGGTPQPTVNGELFEAGFYALDALPGLVDPDQLNSVRRALRIRETPRPASIISTGPGWPGQNRPRGKS